MKYGEHRAHCPALREWDHGICCDDHHIDDGGNAMLI